MSNALSIARRLALPMSGFFATVALGVLMLPVGRRGIERPPMAADVLHPALSADDIRSIIPGDWEVVTSRRRSGGWQQMGTVRDSVGVVAASVSALMDAHGYVLVRGVANPGDAGGGLFAYGNSGGSGRILWSLWPTGRGCTGFAWGIER